jgi:hypothetical protein
MRPGAHWSLRKRPRVDREVARVTPTEASKWLHEAGPEIVGLPAPLGDWIGYRLSVRSSR